MVTVLQSHLRKSIGAYMEIKLNIAKPPDLLIHGMIAAVLMAAVFICTECVCNWLYICCRDKCMEASYQGFGVFCDIWPSTNISDGEKPILKRQSSTVKNSDNFTLKICVLYGVLYIFKKQ